MRGAEQGTSMSVSANTLVETPELQAAHPPLDLAGTAWTLSNAAARTGQGSGRPGGAPATNSTAHVKKPLNMFKNLLKKLKPEHSASSSATTSSSGSSSCSTFSQAPTSELVSPGTPQNGHGTLLGAANNIIPLQQCGDLSLQLSWPDARSGSSSSKCSTASLNRPSWGDAAGVSVASSGGALQELHMQLQPGRSQNVHATLAVQHNACSSSSLQHIENGNERSVGANNNNAWGVGRASGSTAWTQPPLTAPHAAAPAPPQLQQVTGASRDCGGDADDAQARADRLARPSALAMHKSWASFAVHSSAVPQPLQPLPHVPSSSGASGTAVQARVLRSADEKGMPRREGHQPAGVAALQHQPAGPERCAPSLQQKLGAAVDTHRSPVRSVPVGPAAQNAGNMTGLEERAAPEQASAAAATTAAGGAAAATAGGTQEPAPALAGAPVGGSTRTDKATKVLSPGTIRVAVGPRAPLTQLSGDLRHKITLIQEQVTALTDEQLLSMHTPSCMQRVKQQSRCASHEQLAANPAEPSSDSMHTGTGSQRPSLRGSMSFTGLPPSRLSGRRAGVVAPQQLDVAAYHAAATAGLTATAPHMGPDGACMAPGGGSRPAAGGFLHALSSGQIRDYPGQQATPCTTRLASALSGRLASTQRVGPLPKLPQPKAQSHDVVLASNHRLLACLEQPPQPPQLRPHSVGGDVGEDEVPTFQSLLQPQAKDMVYTGGATHMPNSHLQLLPDPRATAGMGIADGFEFLPPTPTLVAPAAPACAMSRSVSGTYGTPASLPSSAEGVSPALGGVHRRRSDTGDFQPLQAQQHTTGPDHLRRSTAGGEVLAAHPAVLTPPACLPCHSHSQGQGCAGQCLGDADAWNHHSPGAVAVAAGAPSKAAAAAGAAAGASRCAPVEPAAALAAAAAPACMLLPNSLLPVGRAWVQVGLGASSSDSASEPLLAVEASSPMPPPAACMQAHAAAQAGVQPQRVVQASMQPLVATKATNSATGVVASGCGGMYGGDAHVHVQLAQPDQRQCGPSPSAALAATAGNAAPAASGAAAPAHLQQLQQLQGLLRYYHPTGPGSQASSTCCAASSITASSCCAAASAAMSTAVHDTCTTTCTSSTYSLACHLLGAPAMGQALVAPMPMPMPAPPASAARAAAAPTRVPCTGSWRLCTSIPEDGQQPDGLAWALQPSPAGVADSGRHARRGGFSGQADLRVAEGVHEVLHALSQLGYDAHSAAAVGHVCSVLAQLPRACSTAPATASIATPSFSGGSTAEQHACSTATATTTPSTSIPSRLSGAGAGGSQGLHCGSLEGHLAPPQGQPLMPPIAVDALLSDSRSSRSSSEAAPVPPCEVSSISPCTSLQHEAGMPDWVVQAPCMQRVPCSTPQVMLGPGPTAASQGALPSAQHLQWVGQQHAMGGLAAMPHAAAGVPLQLLQVARPPSTGAWDAGVLGGSVPGYQVRRRLAGSTSFRGYQATSGMPASHPSLTPPKPSWLVSGVSSRSAAASLVLLMGGMLATLNLLCMLLAMQAVQQR